MQLTRRVVGGTALTVIVLLSAVCWSAIEGRPAAACAITDVAISPGGWFPAPRGTSAYDFRPLTDPREWGSAKIVAVGTVIKNDGHVPYSYATVSVDAVARGSIEDVIEVGHPTQICGRPTTPMLVGHRYVILGSPEGDRVRVSQYQPLAIQQAMTGTEWHTPKPSPPKIGTVRVTTILWFAVPLAIVILTAWCIRARRPRSVVR